MTEMHYPPPSGDQRDMLVAFNNLQRQSLLWKLEGLTEEQLRWKHQPSGLSLLGLLKHMIRVEQTWFQARMLGEKIDGEPNDDDAWNPSPDETFDVLAEQYRQAYTRANEIANSVPLDQQTAVPRSSGDYVTLQWILYHMLEETARHLGHADLIRETIDGATGLNPGHDARRKAAAMLKREELK